MRIEIRDLQKGFNITCIYVTHDQVEAMSLADRIVIMKEGRVEQIAPPMEIYHHPVNRFVADFMGQTNFFVGRLIDMTEASCLIEVIGSKIRADRNGLKPSVKVGDPVLIAIRYEAVVPVPTSEGDLSGRILHQVYLGESVLYEVLVGENRLYLKSWKPEKIYPLGEEIGLKFLSHGIATIQSE
jgi:iron(III) transport system ATP-binding protein